MTLTLQPTSSFYSVGAATTSTIRESTMPADVAFVCSVSPPFAYSSSYISVQGKPRSVYNPFQQFSRVPIRPKTLKSCIKAIQREENLNALTRNNTAVISQIIGLDSVTLPADKRSAKRGKRVTFADTQGRSLTLIRYLTESSSEPPKRLESGELLENLVKKLNLGTNTNKCERVDTKLLLKFEQPIADYVEFKKKIDSNSVSLENLVLKDNTNISGTIKVKNISFQKCVTVRITFDDWVSVEEHGCHFVKNAYEKGNFDTFQFNINLPSTFCYESQCVEFCVRYQCEAAEFWDNNGGNNYVIASSNYSKKRPASASSPINVPNKTNYYYPSTYRELPCAEHSLWENINTGPFY